ncbi:MAG: hypothetical protein ACR2PR_11165 [Pseudohongiellaceae bacterium]
MGNETIINDAHHDAKEGIVSPVMAKAAKIALAALSNEWGDGGGDDGPVKKVLSIRSVRGRTVLGEYNGKKILLDDAMAYFTQWCEARQQMENDDG